MPTIDLDYHGDQAVAPGLLDLAVNVSTDPHPGWLTRAITEACQCMAAYPDHRAATRAVAEAHGRPSDEVLLTSGAAEAFSLIARATAPVDSAGPLRSIGTSVVIHPQFTEPERAMRIAGHQVSRQVLHESDGFRLLPETIADDADLVVIGNPTNPTGVLHRAETVAALSRPGRIVVVDEAFMDAVAGEPETLAQRGDIEGMVVVRSLTKTWGLAGLRIGYVLAQAQVIAALRVHQVPWSVSTPALAAAVACTGAEAGPEATRRAETTEEQRERLREAVEELGMITISGTRGPFLLLRAPDRRPMVDALRARGIAVRRCDTFPGLGPDWIRVAVRGDAERAMLVSAVGAELRDEP